MKEKKIWVQFEERIHDETIAHGMTLMQFPLKTKIVRPGHVIPFKSHPDFVAGILGLAAFFDAKTTEQEHWSIQDNVLRLDKSSNKLHQWQQLSDAHDKGNISGYLLWFYNLRKISWIPSETLKNLIAVQTKFVTPETPGVFSQGDEQSINLKILMKKDIERRTQIIRGYP